MKNKSLLGLILLFCIRIVASTCVSEGNECFNFQISRPLVPIVKNMSPAYTCIKNRVNTIIHLPGSYRLIENVQGTIDVQTDNVFLDLNGLVLSNDTGILINVGQNKKNIVIQNGTLKGGGSNIGLSVGPGTTFVFLEDLAITQVGIGFDFAGLLGNEISSCELTHCSVINCQIAFALTHMQESVLQNCQACNCALGGFRLEGCTYNTLKECRAVDIGPGINADSLAGFMACAGRGNLFYECFTERVFKSESEWGEKTAGFFLGYDSTGEPEKESKIIDCCIDSITNTINSADNLIDNGNEFSSGVGIFLDARVIDLKKTLIVSLNVIINDVDWSPQGQYVAIACQDNTVRVLRFDGTNLQEVNSVSYNSPVNTVAWSPDGQYLAVGTDGSYSVESALVWVGKRAAFYAPDYQEDFLKEIYLLTGVNKELFVYKFDCDLLTLVDDVRVGVNDITLYDGTTQVFSGGGGQNPPPSIITIPGFPGPIRTLPPTLDWNWYGNQPLNVGTTKAADNVLRIIWSCDGRHLFVTTEGGKSTVVSGNTNFIVLGLPGYEINYVYLNQSVTEDAKLMHYTFDGAHLNLITRDMLDTTNYSTALAFSPDDNYVAFGRSAMTKSLNISMFEKFYGRPYTFTESLLSETYVRSVAWNPVACCGTYYLAAVSARNNGVDLQLFEYDTKDNMFNNLETKDLGEDLVDVAWSPYGRSLVVTDDSNNVTRFLFNPQNEGNKLYNPETYQSQVTGIKFVDYSPCGRYLVIAGGDLNGINMEIIRAGDCIVDCVIERNKIANVFGALCSIGLQVPGTCNIVDQNFISGSCIGATWGIYNVYYDMKVSNTFLTPRLLDNIVFNSLCCEKMCQ